MIEKIKKKIMECVKDHEPFDPSVIPDPLAMKTLWTPARGGGANFKTHNLVRKNTERFEYKSSALAVIFAVIFMLSGLAMMVLVPYSIIKTDQTISDVPSILVPVILGFIFAAAGGALMYFGTAPVVFDKRMGYFWKGRKRPDRNPGAKPLKCAARLNDIHAVQILSEYIGGKQSYYSFELNLVLMDGKRLNVVDHGDLNRIQSDSQKLSDFLNVPVWDATKFRK
jgi:hypothetical protein